MEKEEIKKIIEQVIHNPQVIYPPISYKITDNPGETEYTSEYIDKSDFESFLIRLEKQLLSRFN